MSESDAEFVAGLACDVAEELSKLTPGRLWVAERSEQFTAVFVESNGTKIYLKMVRRGATKRIEIGVDPVTLVPTELSPYVSLWEVDDPFTSVRSATNAAGIARRIVRDLLVDADSAAKVVAERVATYRAYCEARDALAEKIIAEYRLAGRPDSDVQIDKSGGAYKLRLKQVKEPRLVMVVRDDHVSFSRHASLNPVVAVALARVLAEDLNARG